MKLKIIGLGNLFYEVLDKTTISQNVVEFKLLHNPQLKEAYELKKQSDLVSYLADGINMVLIINEDVFDKLTDEQKKILLEEALNGILVNDSDKIIVEKPDFSTHTGILQKHGVETMVSLKETVKAILSEKRIKDEEDKQMSTPKKKKKY